MNCLIDMGWMKETVDTAGRCICIVTWQLQLSWMHTTTPVFLTLSASWLKPVENRQRPGKKKSPRRSVLLAPQTNVRVLDYCKGSCDSARVFARVWSVYKSRLEMSLSSQCTLRLYLFRLVHASVILYITRQVTCQRLLSREYLALTGITWEHTTSPSKAHVM